ncbi:hypothetical protein RhiirB3_459075 [Rhizophagus irregularis]|nr:hypothetical protein RhiirB3_459075 [Rhizophagus irregularis]
MSQKIPISILNIKHTPFALTINEAPDIEDQKIVKEVLQYIGKAGYRRDGRNIGRKVKHIRGLPEMTSFSKGGRGLRP